jgi:hypothetical protein
MVRLFLKRTQQIPPKGQLAATKLDGETKPRKTKTCFSLSICCFYRSTLNPSPLFNVVHKTEATGVYPEPVVASTLPRLHIHFIGVLTPTYFPIYFVWWLEYLF